jgi:hypothetical protein
VSRKGDTLAIVDGEGQIREHDPGTELNTEVFDRKHGEGLAGFDELLNPKPFPFYIRESFRSRSSG